jgi:predicted kinase
MRKWMQERLQRRKKTPSKSAEPAPEPLQPAYFDQEPAPAAEAAEYDNVEASSAVADAEMVEPAAPGPLEAHESAEPATGETPAPASGDPARRGRRRRRGGRGRGGSNRERSVAQAFAPAAIKGSAPAGESNDDAEPAPAAPKLPAASAPRPSKGAVVLAIGLPGSGKSSWFKRNNIAPLSSDVMRSLLFDDVREQRFQDLVFSNLRSLLKSRLIAHRPTNYVDATNLTPQERQHWIKLAHEYNYEAHALFFDVPLEVCIERHQRRDRVVPEDVMRRMSMKFKPPTFEEGFSKITVVRVKKKEAAGESAGQEA